MQETSFNFMVISGMPESLHEILTHPDTLSEETFPSRSTTQSMLSMISTKISFCKYFTSLSLQGMVDVAPVRGLTFTRVKLLRAYLLEARR